MKKSIKLYSFILPTVFLFCSDQHDSKVNYSVTAVRSQSDIQIDGKLTEPVWQKARKLFLKNSDTGEQITDNSFSTYFFVCYDDSCLYIAFVANDKDIYSSFTGRDEHLWEEEAVEVFIDVDEEPNNYVEIEVSPNNILFDSYIVDPVNINVAETAKFNLTSIQSAVAVNGTVNIRSDVDTSWTVELAVNFTDIVANFDSGILGDAEWKINLYRIDRDADGPVHYAWSPTQGRFHKPSVFGTLTFE